MPVAAHLGDDSRTVARADMDPSLAVLRDPQFKRPLVVRCPKIPDLRIRQGRVRAGWDDAHGPGLPVLGLLDNAAIRGETLVLLALDEQGDAGIRVVP